MITRCSIVVSSPLILDPVDQALDKILAILTYLADEFLLDKRINGYDIESLVVEIQDIVCSAMELNAARHPETRYEMRWDYIQCVHSKSLPSLLPKLCWSFARYISIIPLVQVNPS